MIRWLNRCAPFWKPRRLPGWEPRSRLLGRSPPEHGARRHGPSGGAGCAGPVDAAFVNIPPVLPRKGGGATRRSGRRRVMVITEFDVGNPEATHPMEL